MDFKELFDKCVDFVDNYRSSIIKASLSILGLILLIIILFISSDELGIGSQSETLLKYIERRDYNSASEYYNKNIKNEFSASKMDRFNKSFSKKLDKVFLSNVDKYLDGQLTKEQYVALVNTINTLDGIQLNIQRIIEQTKRISEMYQSENIDYDTATSYMNITSTLNVVNNELDIYKNKIKELHQSRQLYQDAIKNQEKQKYYEAIKQYDKVLENDKKYYDLAQKNKKQCIEEMYNYYIEKADDANSEGNYEEALQYITYIKDYYVDDERILELEKEYQQNLSLYTLTSEDIINLLAKKSSVNKKNISIDSYQQMLGSSKYYYVEVYEYDILVDELLIDAKTKSVYSYKDEDKSYNTNYPNGYFRMLDNGDVQFAISEEKAQFILKNKLETNDNKYKDVYNAPKEKALKYVDVNYELEKLLEKEEDLYYYEVVNKGWFKKKEVYMINMYTEKVYLVSDDGIKEY